MTLPSFILFLIGCYVLATLVGIAIDKVHTNLKRRKNTVIPKKTLYTGGMAEFYRDIENPFIAN